MRRVRVLAVLVAFLVLASVGGLLVGIAGGDARCGQEELGGAKAVLECVGPALAYLETPVASGSGILVAGGYIVTNAHVVEPYDKVDVVFEGGEAHPGVPVKGVDFEADIALIGPMATDRTPLPLGDDEPLVRGDEVYLVGYPGEVDDEPEPAISRGVLSRRRTSKEFDLRFLQTDAAISDGQSGGALVNTRGQAVGVSGLSFTEQFALALSSRDVRSSIAAIAAGKGSPYRAFPRTPAVTSGAVHLPAALDEALLAVPSAGRERTLRIELPASPVPSLSVMDVGGASLLFNDEAVSLAAAQEGLEPEDLDPGRPTKAVAPGVYEVTIPAGVDTVVAIGTAQPGGADVPFTTSIPVIPLEDGDQRRPLAMAEEVRGIVEALELSDTFVVDLRAGQKVRVSARSAVGDVAFAVYPPGGARTDSVFVDDSNTGLLGSDAVDEYEVETTGLHTIEILAMESLTVSYVLSVVTI